MFTRLSKRLRAYLARRIYAVLGILFLLISLTLTANAMLTVSNFGLSGDADVAVDAAGALNLGTASSTGVVIGSSTIPVLMPGNLSVNGTLTLGSASTTGQLIFNNASTSFTTILQASSSQASNLTFILPPTTGTAGQAMLTDGSGNLYFGNNGSASQWTSTSTGISYSGGNVTIGAAVPSGAPANSLAANTLYGVPASLSAFLNGYKSSSIPNVIYDNDIGSDHDAVMALALLHSAADKGLINIVATLAEEPQYPAICRSQEISVINTYYGRPNIPVGGHTDTRTANGDCMALPASFPYSLIAPIDPTILLRTVLAAMPDNSIVFVAGGPLTNLLRLYNSSPDSISPLTGAQLIAQKIKLITWTGGNLPTNATYNHINCTADLPACQVLNALTVPITLVGYAIGDLNDENNGTPISYVNPAVSPIAFARYAAGYTTNAEDPVGAFLGVYGLSYGGTQFFAQETTPGSFVVDGSGNITWNTSVVKAGQHYVTWNATSNTIAATIQNLIAVAPKQPAVSAITTGNNAVVNGGTVTETLPRWAPGYVAGYAGLLTHLSGGLLANPAGIMSDVWGSYPATITDVTTPNAVQNVNYLSFNGHSYATSNLSLAGMTGGDVSMAVALRWSSAAANARVLNLGGSTDYNAMSIQIGPSGLQGIIANTSGAVSTTGNYATVSTNTWYVVQLTYSQTNQLLTLYVNGSPVATGAATSGPYPDNRMNGLVIGAKFDGWSPLTGNIASAAVWQGAIDPYLVYRAMQVAW